MFVVVLITGRVDRNGSWNERWLNKKVEERLALAQSLIHNGEEVAAF